MQTARRSILVVEDTFNEAEQYRKLLGDYDFQVQCEYYANDVRRKLFEQMERFDIYVVDWEIPEERGAPPHPSHGFALVKEIIQKIQKPSVIVISSYQAADDIKRTILGEYEQIEVLPKPIDSSIIPIISRLIGDKP